MSASDVRGVAAFAGASSLVMLGALVRRWLHDRSAQRRLEEARHVVAEVDRVLLAIPRDARAVIDAKDPGYFSRINSSVEIIHARLGALEQRTAEANVIEMHNAWGPLCVSLNQLADDAQSIHDDVQETSSRAVDTLRPGPRH